jgi:hypothetical protein
MVYKIYNTISKITNINLAFHGMHQSLIPNILFNLGLNKYIIIAILIVL